MEIIKSDAARTALNFVEGVADGLALNYLVEGYKLPGYDMKVFSLGTFQDKNDGSTFEVAVGVDDIWQSALGAVILGLGAWKKNSDVMAKGAGMMVAPWVTKGTEMTGVAIKPDPPVERLTQGQDGVYRAMTTERRLGN